MGMRKLFLSILIVLMGVMGLYGEIGKCEAHRNLQALKGLLKEEGEKFRKDFPGILLAACESTGWAHEKRMFKIVEKLGERIRSNNMYEPWELRDIIGAEQKKQYEKYHVVVNEYRQARGKRNKEMKRMKALVSQSTWMLNYMIAAAILNHRNLNIEKATKGFELLKTVIPSDPWVVKYNKQLNPLKS